MAKEGGFFSPNRKTSSKDKQVASSMSSGSYGGYIDAGESRGFVSPEQADKMIKNPEAYKMRPSETRYLRESMGLPRAQFFNPSGNEVGQIASATTDLGGLSEDENYKAYMKEAGIRYPRQLSPMFHRLLRENMRDDIRDLKFKDGKFINKAPEQNIFQKVGNFLTNTLTGSQPVAAGTLDANQVSQESERPKLSYVNPDAKTMSLSEIADAFKPKNLFGYKDKFGRFDDPGSPLARDRAETIQRVAQNFSSPIVGDARTIGQIRADQEARMRENARLRNESFQRGERVQQKSADVTFGTGMLSNPAYRGLRENMSPEAQKKYDQSAKDATEMARTDPSLGNVAMQTFNRVSGFFGGPQASLEKIGERQLRLANKEINRPTYQKEAYARNFLGITNDQLRARNMQQIQANAAARTQAFQNERVQRALEKAAVRRGENIGTGRDGGFGLGTSGQGMPSNPKGFSGYSRRKSSPGTGTGTGTSTSTSRGGISKSTSRGQGGGPSSRSKGGTGTGKSTQGRGGRRGGSTGGSGASSKGGTGKGQSRSGGTTGRQASKASKSRTGRSRSQCDIRTKIDITSLTNQNLIKDDLATVAYFVQELRGK